MSVSTSTAEQIGTEWAKYIGLPEGKTYIDCIPTDLGPNYRLSFAVKLGIFSTAENMIEHLNSNFQDSQCVKNLMSEYTTLNRELAAKLNSANEEIEKLKKYQIHYVMEYQMKHGEST